ncbi:MAG: hypothetical protein WAL66_19275 [Nitrososphaeraceae archaeon]
MSINQTADEDYWTISYLIDTLKKELALMKKLAINGETIFDCRKYYDQAHHFLKIACFRPVPSFPIYLPDLNPKIIKELYHLDAHDRGYVLKQAVGRIFEDVNSDIYHYSVSRILKVLLVK